VYTHWHTHVYLNMHTCTCIHVHKYTHVHTYTCTANPTWGDILECCFKVQSSKLERFFSLKRGKRDVQVLSFEFSKFSPQVGLAVHLLREMDGYRCMYMCAQVHMYMNIHICTCTYVILYTHMYVYVYM